jgi:hypothetical protein
MLLLLLLMYVHQWDQGAPAASLCAPHQPGNAIAAAAAAAV